MDAQTFDTVLERRIRLMREVLGTKAGEYSSGGDRLHNFRVLAELNAISMEQANWFLNGKHLVSIRDMVLSGCDYPIEQWEEKIGDAINYFVLLEAIVREKRLVTP